MQDKYFNSFEFRRALECRKKDPILARTLFEEYLKKYPKDYSAYLYYCSILVILGELELALSVLNYIEQVCNQDKYFCQSEKMEKLKHNIFFTKIKLLCYQEKNEELYKVCNDNMDELVGTNLNSVFFYAKKKTGRISEEKRDKNPYLFRQIIKYEEEDFFNHIKKHLFEYNENAICPNETIFELNFPIKEVLEEIKKYIPSNKRIYPGFFEDVYFFKYNSCGRLNKKVVNYFKVVCFHNSTDFITMCPTNGNDNLPYIDLNYLIKENPVKVKRLSQLEKFNQRYNK